MKARAALAARRPLLEPFRAEISRCVKCGSCRAVCPSFLADREESLSARGRMALIKAVLDGRLAVSRIYKDRLATCTTCLACEASCASGVPAAAIIQAAKEQALEESGPGLLETVIAGVLKGDHAMRSLAWLAPVALHYARDAFGDRGSEALFPFLRRSLLDEVPDTSLPAHAQKAGKPRERVAFFAGCATNYFQQDLGRSVLAVLARLGIAVVVPKEQKCCGRPLLSLGDRKAAQKLAAHNAAVFAGLNVDAVVTACASCGLTFKAEYPKLLPPEANKPAIYDIHEFLVDRLEGARFSPLNRTVTVHDPCHLGRGQGLSADVRSMLRALPGLALVEMKDAGRCCGFGGAMRVTHRDLSDRIAEEKAGNIIATTASTVAAGCPGCRMQITDALRRAGSNVEVVHPVQLLEEALASAE